MPAVVFLIIAVLIAQLGFWDTLSALFGALAIMVAFVVLAAAALYLAATYFFRRLRYRLF